MPGRWRRGTGSADRENSYAIKTKPAASRKNAPPPDASFNHNCALCPKPRWGMFGYRYPMILQSDGQVWICGEHRVEAERRMAEGEPLSAQTASQGRLF